MARIVCGRGQISVRLSRHLQDASRKTGENVASPFHLGWVVDSARPPAWMQEWAGTSDVDWLRPGFLSDMARALERARFDLMLLADASSIGDVYRGTAELNLKVVGGPGAPSLDPVALSAVLLNQTSRLGLVPTATTGEWHPYLLARNLATLDHISNGRMGWNIVTGGKEGPAKNFGAAVPPHDKRYDIADEYVDITCKLWDSWEVDAVVRDRDSGFYADYTKVHTIDYQGEFYSSRGPLCLPRTPQGRPVLAQAGASPRGREFAARWADIVVGTATSVPAMKEYRQDLHRRMAGYGRQPNDCKIMFLCWPILSDTDAEAQERARLFSLKTDEFFEVNMGGMSYTFDIDLSQFDPDVPLSPDLHTEGHKSAMDFLISTGKSLRELFAAPGVASVFSVTGSPDTVAAKMAETMQEVGGDGFAIVANWWLTRRYISEVVDGLVPALQRRGLTRSEYQHEMFIDNLRAF